MCKQVYTDHVALIFFIKSNLITDYAENVQENIENSQK